MFTAEAIYKAISENVGWPAASRILEIENASSHFETAPAWQLRDAFCQLVIKCPEARRALMKFQPPENTINILSDADMRYATGSATKDAFQVDGLIERHAPGAKNVLDFGCGSGRLVGLLAQFSPERTYSGCDVIAEAISYLDGGGIPGTFKVMQPAPQAPFEDESFDVIFAWSIFSHYSESLHWEWLNDLHRMLRPGGFLLATVHSPESIETQRNDDRVKDSIDFDAIEAAYTAGQFAFAPIYKCFNMPGLDEDNFGQAFIPASYIRALWSELFNVVEIVSAVQGWQDMVVLRRKD